MARMIRVCHADGLVEFELLVMDCTTCVDLEGGIPRSPAWFSDMLPMTTKADLLHIASEPYC